MVNSSTAQYLLWVSGLLFPTKIQCQSELVNVNLNLEFAWWNTLQQSVDTTMTIFCWKVASAEMLIVVLDNQKQPSEVFWISQIPLENLCLQDYNFIRKRLQHRCFLVKFAIFFFFEFLFWKTPSSGYFWKIFITIYIFLLNTSS